MKQWAEVCDAVWLWKNWMNVLKHMEPSCSQVHALNSYPANYKYIDTCEMQIFWCVCVGAILSHSKKVLTVPKKNM